MKYCKSDLEFGNVVWYLDTSTKNIIYAVDGEDNKEYYSYKGVREGELGFPEHLNHCDMWFTNKYPFPQVTGLVKLRNEDEDCFLFKSTEIDSQFKNWSKDILAGRISSDGEVLTSFSTISNHIMDLKLAVNFFLKKGLINNSSMLYWNEEFQGPASYIMGDTEMMLSNKEVTAQAEMTMPAISREDPQIVDLVERYKNGDKEAGDSLFEKYDKLIRGVWYSFLKKMNINPNSPKAEDALQEAYIDFLNKVKDYNPEKSKFSTFVYHNAEGEIMNFLNPKRHKTDFKQIDTPNNTERSEGEINKGLDQVLVQNKEENPNAHISERAEEIISELPEKEQKIIKDYLYNDKTLQEIGDEVGVTRERIRQIINKIIGKIRLDPMIQEQKPEIEKEKVDLKQFSELDTERLKLGMIFKDDQEPTRKLCNQAPSDN